MSDSPVVFASELRADVGDRLVVLSLLVGGLDREGEILEVLNDDGSPPYVVRWLDTREIALVVPGSDAYVQKFHPGRGIPPG